MTSIDAIKSKIQEAEFMFDDSDTLYKDAENVLLDIKVRFDDAEMTFINAKRERALNHARLYDLNIELQKAEALESAKMDRVLERPVGTKYKWTHKTNPETYRVAIQTKKGVLQVKSVTDGGAETHEDACTCAGCWDFNHSAPWRSKKPLKTTYFPDLSAWDATLPENQGRLVITSAPITDAALKALCMKPLITDEDALKLLELERRFPGGVFVLSTAKTQFVISYKRVANIYHQIYNAEIDMSFFNFSDYCGNEKIQLLVEWRGMYIDLSHLF